MTKYHINTDGIVGACKATTKPCPFGADMHFEDRALAERKAEDHTIGAAVNPYRARPDTAEKLRFRDYLEGFRAGAIYDADEEPRLEQLRANSPIRPGAGTFDSHIYRIGFARALRLRDPERTFLDTQVRDYGIDHHGSDLNKYGNVRFLANPFQRGEKILLPAGARYSVWEKGEMVEKRFRSAQRVTVGSTTGEWVNGSVGRVQLEPAAITFSTGIGSQVRHVILTPEILSTNGKPTFESVPAGEHMYQQPIYADIRRWGTPAVA